MQQTTRTISANKHIALVAHDHCKDALIQWCTDNKDTLMHHSLYGTGTSAHLLSAATHLPVQALLSGPMGGDQQLGALIADKKIDMLIFFWDPMNAVPHDPDVKALLRISTVWNIPIAMNRATADFLIHSHDFAKPVTIAIPDYEAYLTQRTRTK